MMKSPGGEEAEPAESGNQDQEIADHSRNSSSENASTSEFLDAVSAHNEEESSAITSSNVVDSKPADECSTPDSSCRSRKTQDEEVSKSASSPVRSLGDITGGGASLHTAASVSSTSQGESTGIFGTLSDNDTYFHRFDPLIEESAHSSELDEETALLVSNFVTEHGILLRASLELLSERDRHAPVVGMLDPVVYKSGPLKKASQLMAGQWKVKFGTFSLDPAWVL